MDGWRLRGKAILGDSATPPEAVRHLEARRHRGVLHLALRGPPAGDRSRQPGRLEARIRPDPRPYGHAAGDARAQGGAAAPDPALPLAQLLRRPGGTRTHNDDFHRSTRYGTDLQLSVFTMGRHTVTLGGEAAYTGVASNFLEPAPEVTDLALFGQDEIELAEGLRGSVGIRLDRHKASSAEGDLTLNPKVGIVYRPSGLLSLRSSLSRGYRGPERLGAVHLDGRLRLSGRAEPGAARRIRLGRGDRGPPRPRGTGSGSTRGSSGASTPGLIEVTQRAQPALHLPVSEPRRGQDPGDRHGAARRTGPRQAQSPDELPLPRLQGSGQRAASSPTGRAHVVTTTLSGWKR